MPAFGEVLKQVRGWFDSNRPEVQNLNDKLRQAIRAVQQPAAQPGGADSEAFGNFARQALDRFDARHGGFGGAPKFPQAPLLEALPVLARQASEPRLLEALHATLEHMARGGLRDQLDGGFFRYSVDRTWTIPHFEKMLYDNALLLPLYAEAAARSGSDWFREVAEGIAGWLVGWLGQANGGFGSSMDADAGGEEGAYHLWQRAEVRECLEASEYDAVHEVFGLDEAPNFEGRAWHLCRHTDPAEPAVFRAAVRKLLERRSRRVPPGTDTKQLAAWNALCADGFARAGRALERGDWLETASACMDFIREQLWRDGSLEAVRSDGKGRLPAYLDDHAFLLRASLSLLRWRWRAADYRLAIQLADTLLEQFGDPRDGGFYFTRADANTPLQRLRILSDDATPNGNGVAAQALLTLGHLSGEPRYVAEATRLLELARTDLLRYPLGHGSLAIALDGLASPPAQVVIIGDDAAEVGAWKVLADRFDGVNCYAVSSGAEELPGPATPFAGQGATVAVVCKGLRCLPPIYDPQALERELDSRE